MVVGEGKAASTLRVAVSRGAWTVSKFTAEPFVSSPCLPGASSHFHVCLWLPGSATPSHLAQSFSHSYHSESCQPKPCVVSRPRTTLEGCRIIFQRLALTETAQESRLLEKSIPKCTKER